MPPTYLQANRPVTVTTPLGPDVLVLVGFSGHEGISQLFSFELDLAAEDQTKVVFDKALGRKITISLTVPGGQKRYFSGICTSLSQGMRGIDHTSFQMEVSPQLWLLTLRSRSRIFQNVSVPEILKKVLDIPDVVYELEGTFHPRPYCVQYRETDFHFASRIMEEEGIYYYFKHRADGHQMVVSDKAAFPELQPSELILQQAEGTHVQEERMSRWQKQQHLRSVKVTLRDHHFQMPQKSLEAGQEIQHDVKVGKVTHKLKIGDSDGLEVYDWPGEYAQRFDAIDRGGAERPDELQRLLKDNERTAKIRMEQEAVESIAIQGSSRYRHLVTGHTFTLKEQVVVPYDGSSSHDGKYVLTSVNHSGQISASYRSVDAQETVYENSFTCVPAALPYRPQRITPKPVITSTQTAVVVGPKGEEIYTDKYGRVKVQFHWDREGKHDAYSSCWIRVGTTWAGSGWGAIHIPRIGQEVIVAFEEGDPDRPIIIGSVYNPDQMPPFTLPGGKVSSGVRSNTTPGGGGHNEMTFDDTKGKERITVHGQYDMNTTIEHDQTLLVKNDRTDTVKGKHTERITKDTKITIETGNLEHDVVAGTAAYHVAKAVTENFDATQDTTVKNNITIKSAEGEILIESAKKITLLTGASLIVMDSSGKIEISGKNIVITGTADIKASAPKIDIAGTEETKIGVATQTVTCNTSEVATSGAGVKATAVGVHEISGAMVKIN